MKHFLYFFFIWGSLWSLSCCSSSSSSSPSDDDDDTKLPTTATLDVADCLVKANDNKLEIVTWNVEHFPKTPSTTKELAAFITDMDADVLALQEIKNKSAFDELLTYLPDYKGEIVVRSDINLAFLYKTSEITLIKNPYTILKNDSYELPRSPYVLPIHSKSTNLDILVINNHYKAYGDAKNQSRRDAASRLIKNWIDNNHSSDNVIVLGDLNDEITDKESKNVFQVFLDDAENYHFADREIALKKNKKQWSFPSYPSHIDHILITNELFDNEEKAYTYTFQRCDNKYYSIISDHQPVCLVLTK